MFFHAFPFSSPDYNGARRFIAAEYSQSWEVNKNGQKTPTKAGKYLVFATTYS